MIVITRDKIYQRARPGGFAWVWSYTVSSPSEYDASGTADEVRRIAKRRAAKTGDIIKDTTLKETGNPSVSKKAITEAEQEAKDEIANLIRESRSTQDALKSAQLELEAIEDELGKRTIPYGGDFYRKRKGRLPQAFHGVPGAILDVKWAIYKEFIDELEQQLAVPKTRKQMLIDYDRGHTLEQLKEMCRAKGYSVSGDKKTLIGRLI